MRRFIAFLLLILSPPALAADNGAPTPQWFLDDIKTLTAGSGRWIADNSAYKSEAEPFESYGVEWIAGFDGTTMSGRLFGLKDGQEVGPFWEFRQYWNPGEAKAIVAQFGWGGAVGIGPLTAGTDGATQSDQVFMTPGRPSTRTGHKSSFPSSTTHLTESFDVVDGVWSPRRTYTWKRQPADTK